MAAPRDLLGTDIQQLMQQAVAARFGPGARPDAPLQWLSDNGSIYTAIETVITAERLHLVPITTPAQSPESNGMSEAFVNTLRRDYLAGADLATAALVLEQIPTWIADYNAVAPHSALGYRSPHEYRGRPTAQCDSVAQSASRIGAQSMPELRFDPALIGTCRVNEFIVQSFTPPKPERR